MVLVLLALPERAGRPGALGARRSGGRAGWPAVDHWDNYDVVSFGTTKIPSDDMYVIDEAFVVQHPEIIDPKNRVRLLRMYATSA